MSRDLPSISQWKPPVAHALLRAVSRLVSTRFCSRDTASERSPAPREASSRDSTRHAKVRAPRQLFSHWFSP